MDDMTGNVRKQRGFTMMEILISLVLLSVGMLGIMALQATTVKANRISRQLERGKLLASQMMEDLRGKAFTVIGTGGAYADYTAEDGTLYNRWYVVAPNNLQPNLKVITAFTRFYADGDTTDMHLASMQLMRTTQEGL